VLGQLSATADAKLLVGVLEVMLHGPGGEHETCGDLPVRQAAGRQRGDLALATRQRGGGTETYQRRSRGSAASLDQSTRTRSRPGCARRSPARPVRGGRLGECLGGEELRLERLKSRRGSVEGGSVVSRERRGVSRKGADQRTVDSADERVKRLTRRASLAESSQLVPGQRGVGEVAVCVRRLRDVARVVAGRR
jgi:hypothetical protein